MASAYVPVYRQYELPWATAREEEQRFRRLLGACVGISIGVALVLSLLPAPESDPAAVDEIPQRFARLVIEEAPPPAPPPAVREAPAPEPVTPEPAPEPVPERVVEVPPPEPAPEPEPVDRVEQARERASNAGLLPFANELNALRDNEVVASLDRAPDAGAGGGEAARVERALVTSRVGESSGGIRTDGLSRSTGGTELAGRATTRVDSPVDGIAPAGGQVARSGGSDRPARSREEIERVFDRHKGAIYALYNRALRQDPTLQGKLVLQLTIAPDGSVTACEIVSSELDDPELEEKLVQRIRLFRFEDKDVEAITTTKPIDFFPA